MCLFSRFPLVPGPKFFTEMTCTVVLMGIKQESMLMVGV